MKKLAIASTIAFGMAAALAPQAARAQGLNFDAGVQLTSNYMSRGVSLSSNRGALQFSASVEASGFYATLFASTVREFGLPDDFELGLYGGYRFSVAAATFDVGYVRYYYDVSGYCCGEFYVLGQVDLDPFTVFGDIYVDSRNTSFFTNRSLGVSYAFDNGFSTSLSVGRSPRGRYNVLSVGYRMNDNASLRVAYHNTTIQRDQLVVTASYNF